MADLKRVYAAPTEETALNELELFKDKWDGKYPKIYKFWYDNWATRVGDADKKLDSLRAPKGAKSACIHKTKLMSL